MLRPGPTPQVSNKPTSPKPGVLQALARAQVTLWNRDHPPGTLVRVTAGRYKGRLFRPSAPPYVDSGHQAVIWIPSLRCTIPLHHLRVLADETRKIRSSESPKPPKTGGA